MGLFRKKVIYYSSHYLKVMQDIYTAVRVTSYIISLLLYKMS